LQLADIPPVMRLRVVGDCDSREDCYQSGKMDGRTSTRVKAELGQSKLLRSSFITDAGNMMDMSMPVVLGTVVAEVAVVISSILISEFLNRSDRVQVFNSPAKTGADGREDAPRSKRPPKTISYKDEKESYFDHSATATQMKFKRDTAHGEPGSYAEADGSKRVQSHHPKSVFYAQADGGR
jgi:hypothetical protein